MTAARTDEAVALRTWIGFLAMCLGMFMAILDIQIVASSLWDIQAALAIPFNRLSWIQTTYLIAEIIAIPLTGWLTRLLSLRGLFLAATAGFILASVGCAISGGFATLIVFRAVQGFCGGALIPAVFTSVFLFFPPGLQVRATVIAGVFAMLAPTLGPILGGFITDTYSWHWLFLINVAPGIVVLMAVAGMVRGGGTDWALLRRIDYASLILLALCLASLELVLKEGPPRGWDDPAVLALLALCLSSGVALARRSLQRPEPLVALRMFRNAAFSAGCFYSFVLGAGLFGSLYLLPLFLGSVRQYSPFEIGTVMLVTGAAQLVAAPIAAPLEKRINRRFLTAVGYSLFALGLLSNGFLTYDSDFDDLFWQQILRGAGVMLCILPTTSLALELQPPERVPDASGLFNLMRNLGGAIGIALIDTILEFRAPVHARHLAERLQAGDPDAARIVGLPLERFQNVPFDSIDDATKALVQPLIERGAAVLSFNEGWLMLGVLFSLSLLFLPLLRETRAVAAFQPTRPDRPGGSGAGWRRGRS